MSYGLQTFDNLGRIQVDISDRFMRHYQTMSLTIGPGSSTTISLPWNASNADTCVMPTFNFIGEYYFTNGDLFIKNGVNSTAQTVTIDIFRY